MVINKNYICNLIALILIAIFIFILNPVSVFAKNDKTEKVVAATRVNFEEYNRYLLRALKEYIKRKDENNNDEPFLLTGSVLFIEPKEKFSSGDKFTFFRAKISVSLYDRVNKKVIVSDIFTGFSPSVSKALNPAAKNRLAFLAIQDAMLKIKEHTVLKRYQNFISDVRIINDQKEKAKLMPFDLGLHHPGNMDVMAKQAPPEAPVVYTPMKMSIPSGHLWQYLKSDSREIHGYATYSYVLVGRDENDQKSASLYVKLVNAIQSSTSSSENLANIVSREKYNLFLIPVLNKENGNSDAPNYELSIGLLTILSTSSPQSFMLPGPYIITLYHPINTENDDAIADILYFDLTNIQEAAIPEIVRIYKEQILNEKLDGIDKLHSIRLAILNVALKVEVSIGFAKAAANELRKVFTLKEN